nr:NAD(P)H-dependent oxidoreductase [Ruegeria arenilitoris]
MLVLTILDHPNPASFSAAVARNFMDGAILAGHSVELADLHAEGFDPRWSMAEIEANNQEQSLPDIVAEQARIA